MKLEHYRVDKLKSEILRVIRKYLDLKEYKVFFFGSRVDRTASERSDIDIGIDGPRSLDDDVLFKIREELGNIPMLYKIDVVDFKSAAENFREVALQKVEWIGGPGADT